jgi:hypothetical protein
MRGNVPRVRNSAGAPSASQIARQRREVKIRTGTGMRGVGVSSIGMAVAAVTGVGWGFWVSSTRERSGYRDAR